MELEKQRNLWKNTGQSGNGALPENSTQTSSDVIIQRTAAVRMQNWNTNNSNNNGPREELASSCQIPRSESNEDFGDIRPQTTPEGYGLKTPYGTHFNLDFMKYCQNLAESPPYQASPRAPRSRSNSQRSSIISNDSKSDVSGSDRDLSFTDTRTDAESNLMETRRRLNAFRSFRKKPPSSKEQQHFSNRFNRSVITSGEKDKALETDTVGSPALTNLLNGPIQQQNLQAMREQMAAALARLKFLENEVKQIQVLQVKISVLQQEKQKLSSELKSYRETSQTKDILQKDDMTSNHSVSTSSLLASPSPNSQQSKAPPPPPRRKYRSVAVGPEADESKIREEPMVKLPRVLTRSELKVTSIAPSPTTESKDACVGIMTETASKHTLTEQVEPRVLTRSELKVTSIAPSPTTESKDACVGIMTETASKHTLTEQVELCNSFTSSSDLIETVTVASGDHILMRDAESQYPKAQYTDYQTQVDRSDFNSDACVQNEPLSLADKAISTDDNIVPTSPKEFKDSSVGTMPGFTPIKRSIATSTLQVETADKSENTNVCVFEDKGLLCKPDVADFECHSHICPEIASTSTETDPAPLKCDALTSTHVVMVDVAGNTENATFTDKSLLCKPDIADVDCSAHILPDVASVHTETERTTTLDSYTLTDQIVPDLVDATSNTEVVQKFDKSFSFHPEVSEFGSNVCIHSGMSVSTSTENAALINAQTNTEVISCLNFTAQVSPMTSDFSSIARILPPHNDASVLADIPLETPEIPTEAMSTQTDLEVLKDWYESAVTERKTVRDVSTGTFSETQETSTVESIQSEIGAYVGQVESLLEEQQSLLAGKYKELGDVLDESDVPKAKKSNEEFLDPPNLPPQLIDDLNAFAKDKYELPSELTSACKIIAEAKNSETDALAVNDALELLREEWFLISALQDSRPDYIKGFASELRALSPYALTKVANSLDDTGNSALHYAVSHEDFGLMLTLADIPELDVDQYNNAGYTASMLAAITKIKTEFEVRAIAALFQRANVSLHAKQAGQTALMLAVSHGCAPAAKLLLKAGADVNAQDEDGSTALMCATEHGQIELVKLLLAHPDCDPTVTDNDGSAAINIAMDSGQRDIGVLLYVHRKLDKSQEY